MVDGVCCYDCHCISQTSGDRTKLTDWAGTAQLSSQLSWTPPHTAHHTNQHFIFSPHSHSPVILTKQIIIIRVYLQKLYCCWKYSPHFLTLLPPCPAYIYSSAQLCL